MVVQPPTGMLTMAGSDVVVGQGSVMLAVNDVSVSTKLMVGSVQLATWDHRQVKQWWGLSFLGHLDSGKHKTSEKVASFEIDNLTFVDAANDINDFSNS
ncbi:hypothetical protein ElyMa_006742200 [Elysia marginata]|uniref:Uncharacterized protein n=1 Tax=Elysia marginata TaxID=1093978 RepID=A0AAV4IVZ2_9GAST|nr:hypothetical protein ElyMa_006742200 [Elysia marginata]